MKKEIVFNVVEDMVKYAIAYPRDDRRWELDSRTQWRYIDESAGKAWEERSDKLEYVSLGNPARLEYEAKRDELERRRPEREHVVTWFLYHQSGWRSTVIDLSNELAEQIEKAWTHGNTRWGSEERKGRLTIVGILKRLGRTDVSEKIKAAQLAEQAAIDKRNRNYNRKQIREAAQKLHDLVTAYDIVPDWDTSPGSSDAKFFERLQKLIKLEDEQ